MNRIRDSDFMVQFPPALGKDESMLALGKLIAEELHITANEIKKNIIYADIESLSETWLDILAYDLHVDWYDYDYPIETKRKLIKNSVKIHQKLGTKYAVQTVLEDVYKTAKVEEWFEYGGAPYTFRIKVDIGNEGLSEETSYEIVYKMQFYKNLRSHCEGIYYILSAKKSIVKAAVLNKLGSKIKVKPFLQNKIRAEAKGVVAAKLQFLNSIKIKAFTEKVLEAKPEGIGTAKAYCKTKLKMTVKKE